MRSCTLNKKRIEPVEPSKLKFTLKQLKPESTLALTADKVYYRLETAKFSINDLDFEDTPNVSVNAFNVNKDKDITDFTLNFDASSDFIPVPSDVLFGIKIDGSSEQRLLDFTPDESGGGFYSGNVILSTNSEYVYFSPEDSLDFEGYSGAVFGDYFIENDEESDITVKSITLTWGSLAYSVLNESSISIPSEQRLRLNDLIVGNSDKASYLQLLNFNYVSSDFVRLNNLKDKKPSLHIQYTINGDSNLYAYDVDFFSIESNLDDGGHYISQYTRHLYLTTAESDDMNVITNLSSKLFVANKYTYLSPYNLRQNFNILPDLTYRLDTNAYFTSAELNALTEDDFYLDGAKFTSFVKESNRLTFKLDNPYRRFGIIVPNHKPSSGYTQLSLIVDYSAYSHKIGQTNDIVLDINPVTDSNFNYTLNYGDSPHMNSINTMNISYTKRIDSDNFNTKDMYELCSETRATLLPAFNLSAVGNIHLISAVVKTSLSNEYSIANDINIESDDTHHVVPVVAFGSSASQNVVFSYTVDGSSEVKTKTWGYANAVVWNGTKSGVVSNVVKSIDITLN